VGEAVWLHAWRQFEQAVRTRCQMEGGRAPQTVDVLTGLEAVLLG